MRKVFVTVGTTRFDDLVATIVSDEVLQVLYDKGFRHLTIQYGNGEEPRKVSYKDMKIESFKFKPAIKDEMSEADLIISHAGTI